MRTDLELSEFVLRGKTSSLLLNQLSRQRHRLAVNFWIHNIGSLCTPQQLFCLSLLFHQLPLNILMIRPEINRLIASKHWRHTILAIGLVKIQAKEPRSRRSMVWHRCISPISAGQLHQLAGDRDSNPPLAATSWSAPPPRTSAPVHSLWRAQRHGTSCRRIYGH